MAQHVLCGVPLMALRTVGAPPPPRSPVRTYVSRRPGLGVFGFSAAARWGELSAAFVSSSEAFYNFVERQQLEEEVEAVEEEEEEAVDGLWVGGPFVALRPGSRTAYAQRRGGGSVRSVGRRHLRPLAVPMVLVPAFFVAVQCFASNIGTLLRHIMSYKSKD
uniref:Uncharacterized protein n=1 Tax=Anopheles merus TaxID=30066 RepID=A0A182VBL8_ANOME